MTPLTAQVSTVLSAAGFRPKDGQNPGFIVEEGAGDALSTVTVVWWVPNFLNADILYERETMMRAMKETLQRHFRFVDTVDGIGYIAHILVGGN